MSNTSPASAWVRRVLLVEDDPFAAGLLSSVLADHGFEVATCANAAQAREEAKAFDPDLAILDVHLETEVTGLQLGHILEKAHPQIAIMYLTRYPAAVVQDRRSREHVRGRVVLDKDDITNPALLLDGIEAALRGREAEALELQDGGIARLTSAQLSALAMMAEGLTNAAIAQRRGTTERAVEKLIEAIYATLGLPVGGERNARVLAVLQYSELLGVRRPNSEQAGS